MTWIVSVLRRSQKTKVWEHGDGGGVPRKRIILDAGAENQLDACNVPH